MFCEGRYLYYYKVYGIKTMKKMALESYKEILDDISEQLQKDDI